MSRLFGTSGVRGITGRDITPALVEALTCAYLRSLPGEGSVCVGYDTRAHAAELAHLAGGHVLMHGGACESLGVVPAGVICNHIQTSGCIGGIYITGSHLPEGHIGVILLDSMAGYIGGEDAERIEAMMHAGRCPRVRTSPSGVALREAGREPFDAYARLVHRLFPEKADIHLVLDPCGGAAAGFASRFLKAVGTRKVSSLNDVRTSRFPREPEPRASSTRELQERVVDEGADLGAAYDIDADRVLFIDERGEPVPEDVTGLILAEASLKEGDTCTAPINSSSQIERFCSKMGVRFEYCGIGQPAIVESMRHLNASYAYEESGKYYVKGLRFACGVLTTLALVELLGEGSLSSLVRDQPEILIFRRGYPYEGPLRSSVMEAVVRVWDDVVGEPPTRVDSFDGVKKTYRDGSWVMVRTSGTERKVRLYVEGVNRERMDALVRRGERLVRTAIQEAGGGG